MVKQPCMGQRASQTPPRDVTNPRRQHARHFASQPRVPLVLAIPLHFYPRIQSLETI